jgi:hypothetical protein
MDLSSDMRATMESVFDPAVGLQVGGIDPVVAGFDDLEETIDDGIDWEEDEPPPTIFYVDELLDNAPVPDDTPDESETDTCQYCQQEYWNCGCEDMCPECYHIYDECICYQLRSFE